MWKCFRRNHSAAKPCSSRPFYPHLELLEDRRLLAADINPLAEVGASTTFSAAAAMDQPPVPMDSNAATALIDLSAGQGWVPDSSHPENTIEARPFQSGEDQYGRPIYNVELKDGSHVPVQFDDGGRPFFYDPNNQAQKTYIDDNAEDYPADPPQEVSGFFMDDEDEKANVPQQVTGSFLWGTDKGWSERASMSFDDIDQGTSDTCAFSSVLSAVARSSFDLASGIVLKWHFDNGKDLFAVRMFQADGSGFYHPVYVTEVFDGTIYPNDLKSTNPAEFWTTLYQRAYLDFTDHIGANYHQVGVAFRALTGQSYTSFVPNGDARAQALQIQTALDLGRPIVASSRDDGPLVLDSSGVIHDHAYTVLGIEVPASGSSGIYVTLRNPWAHDTDWSYFDSDHDGSLSEYNGEYVASQWGLDGSDDGIIRISWEAFARNFTAVTVSYLSGPASNTPLSLAPPVFWNADTISSFTIHEGERLEVDAWAYAPDGGAVSYALKAGSPGYVNLQDGQYTWEPLSGQAGTYTVTIQAEVSFPGLISTSTLTFQVTVLSGAPHIDSLTPSLSTIKDDGTDLLTLTANGVTSNIDNVDFVEFYRDANGNGTLEPDTDIWMGKDENSGDGWAWSGYVGGLTVGSQKFFARAGRYSFSDLHYSNVVSTTVNVVAAPVIPPAAIAAGNQQLVSLTADWDNSGRGVQADAAGNLRVFWQVNRFVGPSQAADDKYDIYTRKYNASGQAVDNAVLLLSDLDQLPALDAVMLADGSFATVWTSGSNLYVQWFTAAGTAAGNRITASTAAGATNAYVDAAADANGNLLIVYNKGDYFAEDVYAVSVSRAGSVTRAPWLVNSHTNSMQKFPTVALNKDGAGVIAWTDFDQGEIIARQVASYGLNNGSEFVVSQNDANGTVAGDALMTSAVNSSGDFVLAWTKYVYPGTNSHDVWARRYGADGQPKAGEFLVNTFRGNDQTNPRAVLNDAGWMAIAWNSAAQDSGDTTGQLGLYAQVYDPQGNPAGGEFRVPNQTDYDQYLNGLVMDADADLTFLWTHGAWNYPETDQVYFRQFGVNLTPEFGGATTFTVPENSPAGTVVGTFAATDPDGDALTYTLVGAGPFSIDAATGQITVSQPALLDFETRAQFVLTVRAADNGNPAQSTLETVTINLSDVNDAPTLRATALTLPEFSKNGTVVGKVLGTDPDAGGSVTYTLVGDSPFTIDLQTGTLTVKDRSRLSYEFAPTFRLTVQVTDNSAQALTAAATVTVQLTDIDELAVLRSDYGFHFLGNYYPGAHGFREKWFADRTGQWWAITPDGQLHQFNGVSFASSPIAGHLDPSIYDDPTQLFQAAATLPSVELSLLTQMRLANGFHFMGTYSQGAHGFQEKWFADRSGQWWAITPDGQLHHWNGVSFASSPVTTLLSPLVYDDPNLLFGAPVTLSTAEQNNLTGLRTQNGFHFAGSYYLNARSQNEKYFQDRLGNWFALLPSGQLALPVGMTLESGSLPKLSPLVYDDPNLLFSAAVALSAEEQSKLSDLRLANGFHFMGTYSQGAHGFQEKWFADRTGQWWAITPDGQLHQWNGVSFASSPVIKTLSPLVYDDPNLLFDAPVTLSTAEQNNLTDLQTQNGFHFVGSYYLNARSQNEKYFQDRLGNWFALLPSGQLMLPVGMTLESGSLPKLSPLVYDDPNLLFNAQQALTTS